MNIELTEEETLLNKPMDWMRPEIVRYAWTTHIFSPTHLPLENTAAQSYL